MRMVRIPLLIAALAIVTFTSTQAPGQGKGQGKGQPNMGMMRGFMTGPYLLVNKSVQEELKITKDQLEKFDAAQKEMRTKNMEEMRDAFGDMEKMAALRTKMTDDLMKVVTEVLKPEQLTRFKEIDLQVSGFGALAKPEVVKALKLTDEQVKSVKELQEEVKTGTATVMQGINPFRDMEKYAEANKKVETMNKKAMEEVAKTLTSEQKAAWKKMIGEKFELKIDPPMPPRARDL